MSIVDEQRGGVLLRVLGPDGATELGFISSDVAKRVTALSSLTTVPGAGPLVAGVALADGAVVTVLEIGERPAAGVAIEAPPSEWIVPGADRAVLCQLGGFDVALTGGVVVATGLFDAAPEGDGIVWQGEVVQAVDVRALYAQAEAATLRPRGAVDHGGRVIGS